MNNEDTPSMMLRGGQNKGSGPGCLGIQPSLHHITVLDFKQGVPPWPIADLSVRGLKHIQEISIDRCWGPHIQMKTWALKEDARNAR